MSGIQEAASEETPAPVAGEQGAAPVEQAPVEASEPVAIDAALSDPDPIDLIQPGEGDPASVVEETVEPVGAGAGGTAVGEQEEQLSVEVLPDGAGYKMGRYQAATLEDLAVEIEKGRRNAEKLIGKRVEDVIDPFLLPEDDDEFDDEFELVDDDAFGKTLGVSIAEALAQSGFGPQQPDPMVMRQNAVAIAQQAIDSPHTSDDDFRGVLMALIEAAPDDAKSRQAVLNEWASRSPIEAAQEATRIEMAIAQHQMFVQQQAEKAALEEQRAEQVQQQQVQQAELVKGAEEFDFARTTFVQQRPDWQSVNAGMQAYLEANPHMMQLAKQAPLTNPENPMDRPRARAVHSVLEAAYAYAKAGFAGGASEQGNSMNNVSMNPNTVAAASQLASEQRDLAGLETGAAVDDVSISLTNPNPPGLSDASFEDLVGISTVK